MPSPRHSPASAPPRLLAVPRATTSLLVLITAMGGVPWLLLKASLAVWPSGVDGLSHLFTRSDTTNVALLALAVIGWIAWAAFTLSVLLEIPAQLRGRRAPKLPGLHLSQRTAATLVGSILLLFTTTTALASATPSQAVTATAPQLPQHEGDSTLAPSQTAPAEQEQSSGQTTYTVLDTRPAESLWSIAEKLYGHGALYTKIAQANEGRTMTDGTRFDTNTPLQPGWTLLLPDDLDANDAGLAAQHAAEAQPLPLPRSAPDGAEDGAASSRMVEEGDNLWRIAKEELGDGRRYMEIFEENRGQQQPGGRTFTNPRLIIPGQELRIPPTTPPPQQPEAPEQPAPPPPGVPPEDSDSGETTPPSSPGDNSSARPAPPTPAPTASGSQSDPAKSPAPSSSSSADTDEPEDEESHGGAVPPASGSEAASPNASRPADHPSIPTPAASVPAEDAPSSSSSAFSLRTVAGAFALLAAAVTGALALRRLLQRRRRKPGETIAITGESSQAEAQLAAAAEPAAAQLLDVALRTLARRAAELGAELPALRAARITPRSVQVLPVDTGLEAMAPFDGPPKDGWWSLAPDAELASSEEAEQVRAPFPGLATLGAMQDGSLVLLNLPQVKVILLNGEATDVEAVCTSLALELGMSPWATDAEIVTVGFGADLPRLMPTARITHMRQADHAVRDLAERLLAAHQLPDEAHQPYLVCVTSLEANAAWLLAEAVDSATHVPVAVIAPAEGITHLFPDAEILDASADRPQHVDSLDLPLTLQRLEQSAYQQIVTALTAANEPPTPPDGAWEHVPDEPATLDGLVKSDGSEAPLPRVATEPAAAKPAVKVTVVNSNAGTGVTDVSGVYPALLSAATDPAGLRPVPDGDTAPAPSPDTPKGPEHLRKPPDMEAEAAEPAVESAESTHGAAAAPEAHGPEIKVLGPVEVTGVESSGHGAKISQLAALLYLKPDRDGDQVCADMDPITPWERSTLNSRMQQLRSRLGTDPDGNTYVPRRTAKDEPYRISPKLRCDWYRFQQLAEHGLTAGAHGLTDLEEALGLVRARPFGPRPLPWAQPLQQEMTVRITDVAHTVATWRTTAGTYQDLAAARQAITIGLEVDEGAEILYRDWMRCEHAAGNRSGLHTAITRVQAVNRVLQVDLEPETEALIHTLLSGSAPVSGAKDRPL
ncbi:hypothetical protein ACFQVC_32695 [Streptomyces monticola]|uniref:Bacterial transcriptional activator domain-containing protein n=1 Tax=Streptomyces monticola TaxID=2666263 RepID=A0ABW2JSJ7_9ACTN